MTVMDQLMHQIAQRDFVKALEIADESGSEVALVQVWRAMAARRALALGLETWGPEASELAQAYLEQAPPVYLPMQGDYAELEALARTLGARGDAVELTRCQLGLADAVTRIDVRVGHVEAAAMLADQLGEAGLQLLCMAYLARLDVALGEDDDAEARIREIRERAPQHGAWLAQLIALELAARRQDAEADLESQLLRARLGETWETIWPRTRIWSW